LLLSSATPCAREPLVLPPLRQAMPRCRDRVGGTAAAAARPADDGTSGADLARASGAVLPAAAGTLAATDDGDQSSHDDRCARRPRRTATGRSAAPTLWAFPALLEHRRTPAVVERHSGRHE